MGCLPAPMLRIGKYSSVPSRVIMFEQVDINKPSCCQRDHGNAKRSREKAMPSVSSQFSYLSHSNYGPTFIPGSIFLGRYYCCLFLPSTLKPKNQNRLSLWARKSSIIWSSVAAGGGRNQLSSERFLIFIRTEIPLFLFTIVVLLPFICPVAKYPIPTPISPLSTATCPYIQRRLCRRDGLSRTCKR